ncbi:ISAs1 family transposase [Streptomyces sp. NPDC002514]|uniref:ISAs1 family transposase n=1 Tax=Streptomyces sp. NPDC001270 TaxID=3364554 RepID=UPI0036C0D26D
MVADPRDARGLRYPALALLCAAVSAVLTGARSLIAISEWITDAPQHVLGILGFAADPLTGLRPVPHAATVRRLLQRVDGDALDAAISAYLQARTPPPVEPEAEKGPVRRVIAVDGKVVRGSRTATAAAIQLLAAMDHHGVVLAQRQVASKSNEIPSFAPLLDGLELENTVVTADALHTQHGDLSPWGLVPGEVEFGVNLSAKAGAVITSGETAVHLKVRVVWESGDSAPDAP